MITLIAPNYSANSNPNNPNNPKKPNNPDSSNCPNNTLTHKDFYKTNKLVL